MDLIQGHLNQAREFFRSTKTKPPSETPFPNVKTQELFIQVEYISKLYTDDMGRFPVCSCSGNHYIMMAFHIDTNATLMEPFQSKEDRHRVAAYDCIMACLNKHGHTIDIHILNNKVSKFYRSNTEDK